MDWKPFGRTLVVALLVAACGEERERAGPGPEPAGEEFPEAEAPDIEAVGYHPDSLSWLREGRPVRFGGREWRPAGRPLAEPARAFEPVGSFEGMVLYALEEEDPPYAHLFFPLGNDVWQALEPADTAAGAAAPPG